VNLIYSRYSPDVEFYSIDESFLFFPDLKGENYAALGHEIRDAVKKEIGIPVSVGIAPTKTLAKLCNKLAKHRGGVCVWDSLDWYRELAAFPVGDVWGVGWSKTKYLTSRGVRTALDLKRFPPAEAQKYLGGIVGIRTVQELNGVPALDRTAAKDRQQIMVSRSFAEAVYDEEQIRTALSEHAQEAVKRLREESLAANFVSVYLMTNPQSAGEHYSNGAMEKLDEPTSFLPAIESAAERLLHGIFRPGYRYRKVMILLSGLIPQRNREAGLFEDAAANARREKLMSAFDAINGKYGRGAIKLAASAKPGEAPCAVLPFEMRSEYLSPCYTTRLSDFPRVH
jgi:DNA polymerase V